MLCLILIIIVFQLFYSRKPKGLNGALQDLGIQFAGREHSGITKEFLSLNKDRSVNRLKSNTVCIVPPLSSGLDDARNTAQLAARMMRDGCVMKITRSLVRVSGHHPMMDPNS